MAKDLFRGRIVVWTGDTREYAPCSPAKLLDKNVFYRITSCVDRFLKTVQIQNAETGEPIPGSFPEKWFLDI